MPEDVVDHYFSSYDPTLTLRPKRNLVDVGSGSPSDTFCTKDPGWFWVVLVETPNHVLRLKDCYGSLTA